jgi:hypothetical protein
VLFSYYSVFLSLHTTVTFDYRVSDANLTHEFPSLFFSSPSMTRPPEAEVLESLWDNSASRRDRFQCSDHRTKSTHIVISDYGIVQALGS